MPGLPVGDSGEGDWGKTGHQVNFYHASVDNDEHHDIQGRHCELHDKGLQEDSQQGTKLHCLKLCLHVVQGLRRDGGGALYQPCRLLHYMLGHVKYRHDDVEGVGEHQHSGEGLENPFEENPGVEVVDFQKGSSICSGTGVNPSGVFPVPLPVAPVPIPSACRTRRTSGGWRNSSSR